MVVDVNFIMIRCSTISIRSLGRFFPKSQNSNNIKSSRKQQQQDNDPNHMYKVIED